MTTAFADTSAQSRLTLTAHPFQRIGAYALATLAEEQGPDGRTAAAPEELTSRGFEKAVTRMTAQAVHAALVRDSKGPEGFWLKASFSFFPNAPMNHPGNGKKVDDVVRDAVVAWRRMPEPSTWPEADCVLCGRQAVGFFGKLDVALAESEAYRNTTPRGHAGMALCHPCRASFHALPYGVQLTGGSSIAVHSWDEKFLKRTVTRQVHRNLPLAETGDPGRRQTDVREVVALDALRRYGERVTAGVELLVFNNNNRGQSLEQYGLEQPLAEWLRSTSRDANHRAAFKDLLRAHATASSPSGVVGLARNAFRTPVRILSSGVRHLESLVIDRAPAPDQVAGLVALLYSFVTEVMQMDEKDLAEIRATAGRVASLLAQKDSGGKLKQFRVYSKEPSKLRNWLTNRGVQWAIQPPEKTDGPLVTERAFTLLFGPGGDNPAWFHRDLLLVGVLEELHRLGWRGEGGIQDDEIDEMDQKFLTDEGDEGENGQ